MATGMQINNIAIPSPMDERGIYLFDTPLLARNGRGAAVAAPYSALQWKFDYLALDTTGLGWWVTTLLGGAMSAEFTQAKFFNFLGALTTYSHCTVYRPTVGRIQDGLAWDVTVTIDWIY
jgi:hypothetical protein